MIFYKVECKLSGPACKNERNPRVVGESVRFASELFNKSIGGYSLALAYRFEGARLHVGVVQKNQEKLDVEKLVADYLQRLDLEGCIVSRSEITHAEFSYAVRLALRNDFIGDDDEFCERNGVPYTRRFQQKREERILPQVYTIEEARRKAAELLCAESFLPEIERIFSPAAPSGFLGHPVHYLLTADSDEAAQSMRELLVGALLGANRLLGRRCCITELKSGEHVREDELEDTYRTLGGGTSVLCVKESAEESEHADPLYEALSALTGLIAKHRRDVLTIVECGRREEKFADFLVEELHGITVVRLGEETVFNAEARKYLRRRAQERGVKSCRALYARLGEGEKGFIRSELDRLFEEWYDQHLRTELYPQYRSLAAIHSERVRRARGSAIDELNAMIGLEEPKRTIAEAIDFHKAQKLFADKGFLSGRPAMHMVFAGNPGTAKTTVARLFAQIMKDNGLLSVGKLVEVGRAELVGRYVGWTAQLVKAKFKAAKGSVLFIDEAYSLVDDRSGLYGDEAINTIVQEMENARDDTVVIFAGYPGKMDEFISRNPGLKSRIAFHVNFPDYSPQELMDIFSMRLADGGRAADGAALEKARSLLEQAVSCPDFGNGRFVRTLIERATVKQAARLMRMEADAVSEKDAMTLCAEDFEQPSLFGGARRDIGF